MTRRIVILLMLVCLASMLLVFPSKEQATGSSGNKFKSISKPDYTKCAQGLKEMKMHPTLGYNVFGGLVGLPPLNPTYCTGINIKRGKKKFNSDGKVWNEMKTSSDKAKFDSPNNKSKPKTWMQLINWKAPEDKLPPALRKSPIRGVTLNGTTWERHMGINASQNGVDLLEGETSVANAAACVTRCDGNAECTAAIVNRDYALTGDTPVKCWMSKKKAAGADFNARRKSMPKETTRITYLKPSLIAGTADGAAAPPPPATNYTIPDLSKVYNLHAFEHASGKYLTAGNYCPGQPLWSVSALTDKYAYTNCIEFRNDGSSCNPGGGLAGRGDVTVAEATQWTFIGDPNTGYAIANKSRSNTCPGNGGANGCGGDCAKGFYLAPFGYDDGSKLFYDVNVQKQWVLEQIDAAKPDEVRLKHLGAQKYLSARDTTDNPNGKTGENVKMVGDKNFATKYKIVMV